MEFLSQNQSYLVAKNIDTKSNIPFLALDIQDNTCIPPRNVFQILHKHEEVEFIIVEKNKLQIQTAMTELIVNEGEGAFIPKNVLHVLNTYGTCICKGFLFPDTILAPQSCEDLYANVSKFTDSPTIDLVSIKPFANEEKVIDSLHQLASVAFRSNNDPNYDFLILSKIYDLWSSFVSNINFDEKSNIPEHKEKGERLKNYLEFISLNYHNKISISDIADSGFTSVSECNRIFKSFLNITAYEYLIKYRINKSLDLLNKENHSITEISQMVGYSSPSQFTKYFKKHMLMSPRKYKSSH